MTEEKIEIIRPNLYRRDDNIYFSIYGRDVVEAGKAIDGIVKDNIGILRNKDSIYIGGARSRLRSSLRGYKELVPRLHKGFEGIGLGFTLNFQTYENRTDIENWRVIESNTKYEFDYWDNSKLVHRLDRKKTLENMKILRERLKKKIPKNYAEFKMIKIEFPDNKDDESVNFGYIGLLQGKDKSRGNLEKCKADLISELREFEGPQLSSSAPITFDQVNRLSRNITTLREDFGLVLFNPNWKDRLFKL